MWQGVYGLDRDDWRAQPAFSRLPPVQQQIVSASSGEMALLAAHAERLNAAVRPAEGPAALERAAEWNRRAEAVFAPDVPAAVGQQRAALSDWATTARRRPSPT